MSERSGRNRARGAMQCPACGADMNRHAARVTEPRNAGEAARMHHALGGVVTEAHSCPECGKNAWRPGR